MLFGDAVVPGDDIAAAGWIERECRGRPGTVGALVPHVYGAVVRIAAPAPRTEDWWSAYRDLYATIAEVGRQHTTRPDRAWFAIWEGHGFGQSVTRLAWREPVDGETRRALEAHREVLRTESERRNAATRAALLDVPAFEVPGRRYYLLTGAVTAVTRLRHPDPPDVWRNPDLFWPADRRWFAATDVDLWSVYVGGGDDLIADLAAAVPTESEIVDFERQLEVEV